MKILLVVICFTLISGCSSAPTYEPNKPTWPKSHKDSRTSTQKRIDREAVHEQQRAIMRGERPDYGVFDRY